MRLLLYVSFFILSFIFQSYCQSEKITIDEFYPFKNEIGINFTNVLGNVLSLNPNNANSPYGLTYRRHLGKSSFRSAMSVDITKKVEDDFSNGNFIQRTISIKNTEFRVGFERHVILHKRILFSYGLDFLGLYNAEYSNVENFNGSGITFTSDQNTFGCGLGPMLRLEYKISDRIFISSECSFYGFYSSTKEIIRSSGMNLTESKSNNSSLVLQLPQSLFFNIAF